jgi:hypothetical protein
MTQLLLDLLIMITATARRAADVAIAIRFTIKDAVPGSWKGRVMSESIKRRTPNSRANL